MKPPRSPQRRRIVTGRASSRAAPLRLLTRYLDYYLRISAIRDSSLNGLQVEGPREVRRVAFAVDARREAFELAAVKGCQLVVAHHGLLWGAPTALKGTFYARLRTLILHGIGLYAAHLPLDMHPVVGNNAVMARRLSLRRLRPTGEYHGEIIGWGGDMPRAESIEKFTLRVERALEASPLRIMTRGRPVRRVACVSGGAAAMAEQIAAQGYDTFVTGEISHGYLPMIEELGINVIFGGHYATEQLGVQALAARLERRFRVAVEIVRLPTGA